MTSRCPQRQGQPLPFPLASPMPTLAIPQCSKSLPPRALVCADAIRGLPVPCSAIRQSLLLFDNHQALLQEGARPTPQVAASCPLEPMKALRHCAGLLHFSTSDDIYCLFSHFQFATSVLVMWQGALCWAQSLFSSNSTHGSLRFGSKVPQ